MNAISLKATPAPLFADGHWLSTAIPNVPPLYHQRREKVSVVVPCLNEAEALHFLLPRILPYCDEIVVVDGHSTDETESTARLYGAKVFRDNRKGKGEAMRVGIKAATHEIVVFIDADLSHDPGDIPKLVLPILAGESDHVVGSRPRGGSDELHGDLEKFARMIGSDLITLGINYRFNVRLTESQNGFRAIRRTTALALDLQENITTIEQEMTIKSLASNVAIKEVPAHEYARAFGESRIQLRKVAFRYVYSWLYYLFIWRPRGR